MRVLGVSNEAGGEQQARDGARRVVAAGVEHARARLGRKGTQQTHTQHLKVRSYRVRFGHYFA